MSVELFKVKKCSRASKGFEFLKLAAKPNILENLKRSWKKLWEVMEFEELKRLRTLYMLTIVVEHMTINDYSMSKGWI